MQFNSILRLFASAYISSARALLLPFHHLCMDDTVVSVDLVKARGRSRRCFGCFSPTRDDDNEPPIPLALSSASDERRKSSSRNFSGSLKALLFKTSLVKKLRSKRHSRDASTQPSRSATSSIKSQKLKNPNDKKSTTDESVSNPGENFGDTSDRSSLFTSTSSTGASSISSDSRTGFERMPDSDAEHVDHESAKIRIQLTVKRVGRLCNYTTAFIFLVCLAALVFWGKVFAVVICASAGLIFGPSYCRAKGLTCR